MFNVSRWTASRTLSTILPLLESVLKKEIFMPKFATRKKESVFFGDKRIAMVVDGSEQRILASSDSDISQVTFSVINIFPISVMFVSYFSSHNLEQKRRLIH